MAVTNTNSPTPSTNSSAQKEAVPTLNVVIKDKKSLIFSGEVASITSFNDVGEFDVLDAHANFISIISTVIIINKAMPEEKRFSIDKAVMIVNKNSVQVFVQS